MSTGDNTDFSKLSGLHELQEAARQLFGAYVLTDEEYRTGRIAPTFSNASSQLVATTTSQSQDIEAQRAAAIQKLQGALSKVPHDQRADLQARIDAVAGATNPTQIDALTTEALRDIEAAAQFANTGTNIQDLQNREDGLAYRQKAFLKEWEEYKKDSQKMRSELGDQGYRDTPENEKELAGLYTKLEVLQPFSPEWRQTIEKIYTMDADFFGRTEEQLRKNGKYAEADKVHKMWEETQKSHEKLSKFSEDQERSIAADRADKSAIIDARNSALYADEDETALAMQETEPKNYLAEKKATVALAHAEIDTSETGNLTPLSVGTKATGGRTIS